MMINWAQRYNFPPQLAHFRKNPIFAPLNQYRTAMKYDSNPVRVLFDNENLKQRLLALIEGHDAPSGITFTNLCFQIRQQAINDRAVANADDTTYTNDEIAPEDQVRVSRLLWELILEHKIFLLFGRSELLGLSNGEDRFVKY